MMKRRSVLAALGWAAVGHAAAAAVRAPPPVSGRRLKLYNVHTGETFDGPYRSADGVIDTAAAELSQFMRDHHSGVAAVMDVGVIDFLSDVLAAVGAASATILSAYRTPETNAMLARTTFGVAEHSLHMYARAIDFTVGGASLERAMTAARAMRRGGVGWYPHSHFIHVDSGPVRNWDLGDADLQRLLLNPANGARPGLRNAALTGRAHAPPRSQYAAAATSNEAIRPSAYTAAGASDRLIRPSPYGGGS
ncbi:MAG TPA: DUF882 domain-containing protein [Stellaceae bacterium]|nr:DUF882 domain-containing protein [Stellaceae bacterium]